MSESDGPEDVWASTHEQDLIGLRDDEACEIARGAGFEPAVFAPRPGLALALLKVRGQVLMFSNDGRITGVRSARPRRSARRSWSRGDPHGPDVRE